MRVRAIVTGTAIVSTHAVMGVGKETIYTAIAETGYPRLVSLCNEYGWLAVIVILSVIFGLQVYEDFWKVVKEVEKL